MPNAAETRRYGTVFNEIAGDYDRHRPGYPDALIDRACEQAGLRAGDPVLEIGCGTGQLTRSLLERGLRVTAIEPGEKLIARARGQLQDGGDVRFIHARLEDVALPQVEYGAVFCASAIHWIDPDVSWRTAAGALAESGTLALLSYFGLEDSHSAADQQAMRAALAGVAPELAGEWPVYRDLDAILGGVAARRDNVSEIWAWLGGYSVGRRYAGQLFEDAQVALVTRRLEHTAGELNALLGTMSFWARLSPRQRDALVAENEAVERRLGRPIRSSTVACLVTAPRAS
jgi:SAM-dependent methyltransferase